MSVKKLLLWLLPWYPVLQIYHVGSLPMAFYIYTPLLLVMLVKRKSLKVDKSLLILFGVTIFIQVIQMALPYISLSITWHNMLVFTVSLLSIVCVTNYVSLKDMMIPYIVTCVIFILGLFFQVAQIYIMHSPVTGPITLFPNLLAERNIYLGEDLIRPMSFFSEPQAFATFIIVFIVIMLEEKRFFLAAFATMAVLLSTSTEGLFLSIVVWGLYVLFSKTGVFMKVIIIIGLVVVAGWYMSLDYFSVGLEKTLTQNYNDNARLVNGFIIMENLDFTGWLFGMGTANNSFYAQMKMYLGQNDSDSIVYFSSATGVFIMYGIFVGLAFWVFLLKKIRFKFKSLFIYAICLIIIPFAQTCFWSPAFVYLMSFYYLLESHCKEKDRLINYQLSMK